MVFPREEDDLIGATLRLLREEIGILLESCEKSNVSLSRAFSRSLLDDPSVSFAPLSKLRTLVQPGENSCPKEFLGRLITRPLLLIPPNACWLISLGEFLISFGFLAFLLSPLFPLGDFVGPSDLLSNSLLLLLRYIRDLLAILVLSFREVDSGDGFLFKFVAVLEAAVCCHLILLIIFDFLPVFELDFSSVDILLIVGLELVSSELDESSLLDKEDSESEEEEEEEELFDSTEDEVSEEE